MKKMMYILLAILLAFSVITAGCEDKEEDKDEKDTIGDDDTTGDDDNTGDDDTTGDDDEYLLVTVHNLTNTPYSFSGKMVKVKGVTVVSTKTGYSCLITDESTSESLTLYAYDESLNISAGKVLDVQGIFEQYQDKYWEIKIRSNTNDKVVVTGSTEISYEEITLAVLMASPDDYNNQLVKIVEATVTAGINWKFNISDGSNVILVYTPMNSEGGVEYISVGDVVTVQGQVQYYSDDEIWEIVIRQDTDDKITVVGEQEEPSLTYSLLSVNELLTDSSTHKDKGVRVENAVVTSPYFKGKFNISDDSTTENLLVYVDYGAQVPSLNLNDNINIQGEFTEFYGTWEIKIRKDTDDNISVVGQTEVTYEEISLTNLMNDPASKENNLVKIVEATVTAGINWKFNITDGTSEILVYTPMNSEGGVESITVGDVVTVQGQVQYYSDDEIWEIVIRQDSDDKITIVEEAPVENITYLETNVSTLRSNATNEAFRDQSVKLLNVTVISVSSTHSFLFCVNDTTGPLNINLTIYGWEYGDLAAGDRVNIYGIFEWYAGKGYWEIKIRNNEQDKVEVL